jgi:hypothetical protein
MQKALKTLALLAVLGTGALTMAQAGSTQSKQCAPCCKDGKCCSDCKTGQCCPKCK